MSNPLIRMGKTCAPDQMGIFDLFAIPVLRMEIESVTPEEMTKFLTSHMKDENRVADDQDDVKYQDFMLNIHNPDPMFREFIIEVLGKFAGSCGYEVDMINAWTICHEREHQTFPHDHSEVTEQDLYACVYWAQTPEGSGKLEFYPFGLPGPTIEIIPKAGHFMVFPSDLYHGVRQNLSDDLRVSCSMNMRMNREKPLDYSKSK